MTDHDPVFPISELARASGVPAPTIRYYETIGLLPAARRSAAGHRYFSRRDVDRLTFIRRCREIGFPIAQVRRLVGLSLDPARACGPARDIVADRLARVRDRLAELQKVARELEAFVAACDNQCRGAAHAGCRMLSDLAAT